MEQPSHRRGTLSGEHSDYPFTMRLSRFKAGGLVVALVGFGLTRFTVTNAAMGTTAGFLFAGVIPLVLGLGLSAAGVFLAVGQHDRLFVRTVAVWCLAGTGAMGVLALLTLLGSDVPLTDFEAVREQVHLSTFLIGGAVGGALTGVYAGRNRCYQRDLRAQTNRLVVLNRLLRDRVVNSATAIRGHQELLDDENSNDSVAVIGRKADDIVDTVARVNDLAESSDTSVSPLDLTALVRRELSTVREAHPGASFTLDTPGGVTVRANERLGEAVRHLLVNAAEHSNSEHPRVEVSVETAPEGATLRVRDDGPGLPEKQQAVLEQGDIAEYDDPTTGFGLNIVRLVAEQFDGRVRTAVTDAGTTVELTLPRGTDHSPEQAGIAANTGVHRSRAALAAGAALIAGLTMAGVMATLDGELLAIGELYGIADPVVALVTHEFHSVVFGLMYLSVLAVLPVSPENGGLRLAVGLVFGLSLWLFAAGVVMPLWLQLVGISAAVPNLTVPSLAGHLTWGGTVSLCYHAGDRWLAGSTNPILARLGLLKSGTSGANSPGNEPIESN